MSANFVFQPILQSAGSLPYYVVSAFACTGSTVTRSRGPVALQLITINANSLDDLPNPGPGNRADVDNSMAGNNRPEVMAQPPLAAAAEQRPLLDRLVHRAAAPGPPLPAVDS